MSIIRKDAGRQRKFVIYINPDILAMLIKPLWWLGDSKRRVREFPQEARQQAGFELWEIQQGNDPSDWPATAIVHLCRNV